MRRFTWISLSWSRLVWIARRFVHSDRTSYDSLFAGVIMLHLYKRKILNFFNLFLKTRIIGISLIAIWFSLFMTVMFCSLLLPRSETCLHCRLIRELAVKERFSVRISLSGRQSVIRSIACCRLGCYWNRCHRIILTGERARAACSENEIPACSCTIHIESFTSCNTCFHYVVLFKNFPDWPLSFLQRLSC